MGKSREEQIVRQMADFYRQLKGFEVSYHHRLHVEGPNGVQEVTWKSAVMAQRPNRVAMRQRQGTQGIDLVVDGEDVYLYVPLLKRFTQTEAPPTFDQLAQNPVLVGLNGGGPFFLQLLADDPYRMILEGVTSITYVGEETIEGTPVHHLRFAHEKTDWDLWVEIGPQPLVYRQSVDVSRLLQALGQAPRGTRAVSVQTYLNWRPGVRLPADAFVFQPPAEVTRVNDLFASSNEALSPIVGRLAPDFQLPLLGGGVCDLKKERGQGVVLLAFWATWCKPCAGELRLLAELAAKYRERGLIVYTVNHGEEPRAIEAFLETQKLPLSVLLDSHGEVADRYGVPGLPMVVLIDAQGVVRRIYVGYDRKVKAKLVQELDGLMGSGGS